MKAGRELDALIAENVIGLQPWPGKPGLFRAPIVLYYQTAKPCLPPEYSTDISAAWTIVERLSIDLKSPFTLEFDPSFKGAAPWYAEFDTGAAWGNTPTEAICLAALSAIGKTL